MFQSFDKSNILQAQSILSFIYSNISFKSVTHDFTLDKIMCFNTFVSSIGLLISIVLSCFSNSMASSSAFTIFQLNANAIQCFR